MIRLQLLSTKYKAKKYKWTLYIIGGILLLLIMIFASIFGKIQSDCDTPETYETSSNDKVPKSVDDFVKTHKDAYILSWKAGGFLPSASIAQTMVENGFSFTNPQGTSFWKAHNMGGVKTSKKADFPVTFKTYGDNAIDFSGKKDGASVGDNTGGAYTWFKSYDAGIVGKAEFMAHQSLYSNAINNTDGQKTLEAIFKGGWATDPSYLSKLKSTYDNLGKKYGWLDKEAIDKYGKSPYTSQISVDSISRSTMNVAVEGSQTDFNINCSVDDSGSSDSNIVQTAQKMKGYFKYGQSHPSPDLGSDLKNPNKSGTTDCSGFVWLTLNKAGYKVPDNMGWFTGSMASDAKGSHQYLKQISESEAKAGDIVIVNQGAGAGNNGHTAILLGKWQGKDTKIIQEGGDTTGHVNEGKFGTSFSTLLDGGDVVLARPVKK